MILLGNQTVLHNFYFSFQVTPGTAAAACGTAKSALSHIHKCPDIELPLLLVWWMAGRAASQSQYVCHLNVIVLILSVVSCVWPFWRPREYSKCRVGAELRQARSPYEWLAGLLILGSIVVSKGEGDRQSN